MDWECIEKILSNLIGHETDPVRKNLSEAKMTAVKLIFSGDNLRISFLTLCSYFDESITKDLEKFLEEI